MHGPSGKEFEIYCLVSKQSRITNISKQSGSRKIVFYRLQNINDQDFMSHLVDDVEQTESNLKSILDNLRTVK